MSVALMPLAVAPPLLPLKATHGGVYRSPGTCSLRSGHGLTSAVAVAGVPLATVPPALAPVPPLAPAAGAPDPVGDAAAPVADVVGVLSPGTAAACVPPAWSAVVPLAAPSDWSAVTFCGALDGTRVAISSMSTASTANGP